MARYKGYKISPVYAVGSDWDYTKEGVEKTRRRKKEDIEYFECYDPIEDNIQFVCSTNDKAKRDIDDLLIKLGVPDNRPNTWKRFYKKAKG